MAMHFSKLFLSVHLVIDRVATMVGGLEPPELSELRNLLQENAAIYIPALRSVMGEGDAMDELLAVHDRAFTPTVLQPENW